MGRKLIDHLSLFVIIWTLVLLLFYGFLTLYPFKIVRFLHTDVEGNGMYKVIDTKVERGGLLRYQVRFEKLMNRQGVLNCFFEDGILFRVPTVISNNRVGKVDFIQAISVPDTLPLGEYRYSCLVTYTMFFDRDINYFFYTDKFEVVDEKTE